MAEAKGAGAFSTTLLASREQDRDLVALAGKEAGEREGLRFVSMDLRQLPAPEKLLRGIYKQQYCGCIFSEEERYRNTNKHMYRPGGAKFPEEADDESP
jgi:predicted adenine nucleotide alpha hydrolase (AANH) superfamily ATPase